MSNIKPNPKIKEYRKAAGFTQEQFSSLFNPPIPIDTIKKWDAGKMKPPDWVEGLVIEKIERRKEMAQSKEEIIRGLKEKREAKAWTYAETAKAIGGAVSRAAHLSVARANRVINDMRAFSDVANSAADGNHVKFCELISASNFGFVLKELNQKNESVSMEMLSYALDWLAEHSEEEIPKKFYGFYFFTYSIDLFRQTEEME